MDTKEKSEVSSKCRQCMRNIADLIYLDTQIMNHIKSRCADSGLHVDTDVIQWEMRRKRINLGCKESCTSSYKLQSIDH